MNKTILLCAVLSLSTHASALVAPSVKTRALGTSARFSLSTNASRAFVPNQSFAVHERLGAFAPLNQTAVSLRKDGVRDVSGARLKLDGLYEGRGLRKSDVDEAVSGSLSETKSGLVKPTSSKIAKLALAGAALLPTPALAANASSDNGPLLFLLVFFAFMAALVFLNKRGIQERDSARKAGLDQAAMVIDSEGGVLRAIPGVVGLGTEWAQYRQGEAMRAVIVAWFSTKEAMDAAQTPMQLSGIPVVKRLTPAVKA